MISDDKETPGDKKDTYTVVSNCHKCHRRPSCRDYNGHGYMVCQICYDILTDYFESEYS